MIRPQFRAPEARLEFVGILADVVQNSGRVSEAAGAEFAGLGSRFACDVIKMGLKKLPAIWRHAVP